jgi:hypothetical protein
VGKERLPRMIPRAVGGRARGRWGGGPLGRRGAPSGRPHRGRAPSPRGAGSPSDRRGRRSPPRSPRRRTRCGRSSARESPSRAKDGGASGLRARAPRRCDPPGRAPAAPAERGTRQDAALPDDGDGLEAHEGHARRGLFAHHRLTRSEDGLHAAEGRQRVARQVFEHHVADGAGVVHLAAEHHAADGALGEARPCSSRRSRRPSAATRRRAPRATRAARTASAPSRAAGSTRQGSPGPSSLQRTGEGAGDALSRRRRRSTGSPGTRPVEEHVAVVDRVALPRAELRARGEARRGRRAPSRSRRRGAVVQHVALPRSSTESSPGWPLRRPRRSVRRSPPLSKCSSLMPRSTFRSRSTRAAPGAEGAGRARHPLDRDAPPGRTGLPATRWSAR